MAGPASISLTPPQPDAPGQFAFADGDRVKRILEGSGWREVDVRPIDVPSTVAEADLLTYVTRLGPAGAALREADAATRAQAEAALKEAFEPFVHDGAARFASACWLVRASA